MLYLIKDITLAEGKVEARENLVVENYLSYCLEYIIQYCTTVTHFQ